MTDPIAELAGMLDSGTTSGEVMGTAAAASSGGQVQVMVGPNAIACTDLPSRPAAAGDTLVIRSGNAPAVVRNLTREKNPPAAPASASVTEVVSSGMVDDTITPDDWDLVQDARDYTAAVTRGLAGDINVVRGDLSGAVNKLNDLIAKLEAQGVLQ